MRTRAAQTTVASNAKANMEVPIYRSPCQAEAPERTGSIHLLICLLTWTCIAAELERKDTSSWVEIPKKSAQHFILESCRKH